MEQTDPLYLAAQFLDDRFGKRDDAVYLGGVAFAVEEDEAAHPIFAV